jgi:hypothetical protein
MATQVQFRRGTTADTASFTGASGEITVDLTKHVCVVHDAIQVGGYPLMLESGVNSALSLGTLSNCSLKFLNDPNTGFFSPGPDQLSLVTGGVARITIDSAGAVTIPGNLLADAILQMQSGTASAPALTFDGDTNTGIYSPGADQLAVSTGGTGRLFVDSSGNVGIGTSSPGNQLHVAQDFNGNTATRVSNSNTGGSAYSSLYIQGSSVTTELSQNSVNRTFLAGANGFYINTGASSPLAFAQNGTARLYIDSAGKVGIGTSSPRFNLSLGAFTPAASATPTTLDLGGSFSSTAGANPKLRVYWDGADYYGFGVSAGQLDYMVNSSAPGIAHVFYTNSVERLRIASSGNVGIGTSSPGKTLEVNGETYITGGIASQGAHIYRDGGTGGAVYSAQTGDTSVISPGAANVRLETNGLERLRIDSSGNVGIGTSNPGYALDVAAADATANTGYAARIRANAIAGAGALQFTDSAATAQYGLLVFGANGVGTLQADGASSALIFSTNSTERLRIDNSGKLLVGTSSARTVREVVGGATYVHQPNLQLETGNNSLGLSLITNRATDSTGPFITLGKSRGGTLGSVTVVQNGDELGNIYFAGADGTDIECIGAAIFAEVDGTPGANDMPGRLVFSTTADGASSPTERVRITQSGDTLFGCTAVPSASVYGAGFIPQSNGRSVLITSTSSTASNVLMGFYNPNGFVGNITVDGSATSYNTSSDYRLKENVVPLIGAIDRIQQIPVHRFNFIADPDKTVDGFIAHEAQAVVPECVTGEKDAVDDDGNPIYQGIDQSKLVPLLTAALQEAITKIETLEAAVAALQSA